MEVRRSVSRPCSRRPANPSVRAVSSRIGCVAASACRGLGTRRSRWRSSRRDVALFGRGFAEQAVDVHSCDGQGRNGPSAIASEPRFRIGRGGAHVWSAYACSARPVRIGANGWLDWACDGAVCFREIDSSSVAMLGRLPMPLFPRTDYFASCACLSFAISILVICSMAIVTRPAFWGLRHPSIPSAPWG